MITPKRDRSLYLKNYHARPEVKARQKISAKKWRENNPLYLREWKKNNPEKVKESARKTRKNSYFLQKENIKKSNMKARLECLNHYSNGIPKCVCCEEKEIMFLALDHIDGGGNKHRKGKGNITRWIIKNNFPPIFQILCHNCNLAKGFYGKCPHLGYTTIKKSSINKNGSHTIISE